MERLTYEEADALVDLVKKWGWSHSTQRRLGTTTRTDKLESEMAMAPVTAQLITNRRFGNEQYTATLTIHNTYVNALVCGDFYDETGTGDDPVVRTVRRLQTRVAHEERERRKKRLGAYFPTLNDETILHTLSEEITDWQPRPPMIASKYVGECQGTLRIGDEPLSVDTGHRTKRGTYYGYALLRDGRGEVLWRAEGCGSTGDPVVNFALRAEEQVQRREQKRHLTVNQAKAEFHDLLKRL